MDFVCNLNTLVGVHQHPVDQQLGQLGGQRVRIEDCLGRFLAAVLPCLFVLLLFRLCQYCGIGVFRFQKQFVTRGLFCLVGVQVDLAYEIAFVKCALAVLQRLDLLLIFGAFRYGSIYPERTVRGKRRGGFHLLFQRQEYRLFQLCGVQTHLVAAAFFVRFGMAAVIIRGFLHGAGQRMTAAATEGFALQRVVPHLFVGLGKAELAGLHGIKHGFLNDGRVMVGDDVPRFSVLQAASGAAYFENRLITKADGKKFGKTESGNIWLDPKRTSPYKFYQFWLNVSDDDAERYIKIFTSLDKETIDALVEEHRQDPGRRTLQRRLAEEVTVMVHSREDYDAAVEASNILFGKSTKDSLLKLDEQTFLDIFEGVPQFEVSKDKIGLPAVELFTTEAAVFASKGEMRKLVQGGGVSLNKEKLAAFDREITSDDLIDGKYLLVQRGKKNYFLITVK